MTLGLTPLEGFLRLAWRPIEVLQIRGDVFFEGEEERGSLLSRELHAAGKVGGAVKTQISDPFMAVPEYHPRQLEQIKHTDRISS